MHGLFKKENKLIETWLLSNSLTIWKNTAPRFLRGRRRRARNHNLDFLDSSREGHKDRKRLLKRLRDPILILLQLTQRANLLLIIDRNRADIVPRLELLQLRRDIKHQHLAHRPLIVLKLRLQPHLVQNRLLMLLMPFAPENMIPLALLDLVYESDLLEQGKEEQERVAFSRAIFLFLLGLLLFF